MIELRKLYDLGFNVWFQPSSGEFSEALSQIRYSCDWSVPSQASVGDLLLMYKATPYRFIDQIFLVSSGVVHEEAGWKPGKDYGASIRLICSLKAPLHFQELKNHPILGHAGFVRGQMRNRYKATEYWPELFQMILARNPDLRGKLKKYGPDRLS